jgi:two-component system cell cycle response regulator
MSSHLLDDSKLFRHVLEDLPVGIYLLDRERRICFWNHGAEHLTGHLAHEVVGHVLEDVVKACDRQGNNLRGEHCPVITTLHHGEPRQCTAFYLHKDGHRTPVNIRTRAIFEHEDAIAGVTVLFEEAFAHREESSGPPMYGCLDAITGVPSLRLTKAVLNECTVGVAESHIGFGVLRVRVLGLEAFRSKHGAQAVLPFLRTAANTLRHGLNPENFLGCWGEHEFLAVLPSTSPVTVATTAEMLWNLLSHSEVSWWGDRFPVETEIAYTVVNAGNDLESLLREMKPAHSSQMSQALAAGAGNDSGRLRG